MERPSPEVQQYATSFRVDFVTALTSNMIAEGEYPKRTRGCSKPSLADQTMLNFSSTQGKADFAACRPNRTTHVHKPEKGTGEKGAAR